MGLYNGFVNKTTGLWTNTIGTTQRVASDTTQVYITSSQERAARRTQGRQSLKKSKITIECSCQIRARGQQCMLYYVQLYGYGIGQCHWYGTTNPRFQLQVQLQAMAGARWRRAWMRAPHDTHARAHALHTHTKRTFRLL